MKVFYPARKDGWGVFWRVFCFLFLVGFVLLYTIEIIFVLEIDLAKELTPFGRNIAINVVLTDLTYP